MYWVVHQNLLLPSPLVFLPSSSPAVASAHLLCYSPVGQCSEHKQTFASACVRALACMYIDTCDDSIALPPRDQCVVVYTPSPPPSVSLSVSLSPLLSQGECLTSDHSKRL